MGLFKSEKPYTAISSKIDRMTTTSGEATDPAALVELIELIQINSSSGTAEAGRALRKHVKHGDSSEQVRAILIAEAIVANGGRKMVPLVRDTGLGDQMQITARTGPAKPRKYAAKALASWAANFAAFSHYAPASKRFDNADHYDRGESRDRDRDRDTDRRYRDDDRSHRYREDEDEDDIDYDRSYSHSRGRSPERVPRSRTRSPSRSPSPLNLRGQSLESTIALGHSTATHLVNSMITHDGQIGISRETAGYYEQAKQIRRRVLRMITDDSPEVLSYVDQLLKVNEEIMEAIVAYEDADTDVRPTRRAPERSPRPASRPASRPSSRPSSRPPPRSPPSNSFSPPSRAESPIFDDDDPFADSNEAVGAPQHTPVW